MPKGADWRTTRQTAAGDGFDIGHISQAADLLI
jgi:hypothetical protein